MKKLTRMLTLILCLTMLVTCVACAPNPTISGSTSNTSSSSTERPTIKMFLYDWPSKDDAAVKEAIDEKFNVNIEWVACPGDQGWAAQEQLLAADPTIDVFYMSKSMFTKFASQDILLDVGKYMTDGNLPNLKEFCGPSIDMVKNKNGIALAFPYPSNASKTCFYAIGVRQDWLDEANLSMPKTIADLDNVLAEFKKRDPSKYPLLDQPGGTFLASTLLLAKSFSTGGAGWWLDSSDGLLKHPVLNAGFKDYLAKMAEWYTKGYLHPQFVEMSDSGKVTNMLASNETGVVFSWITNIIQPNQTLAETDPDAKFVYIPYTLTGPEGSGALGNPDTSTFIGINKNSKYADIIVKVIDGMLTQDGTYLVNYGIEGRNFDIVDGLLKKSTNPEYDYQGQYNPYGNTKFSGRTKTGDYYNDTQIDFYDSVFFNKGYLDNLYHEPDANIVYDYTGTSYLELQSQVNTFIVEAMYNTITGKSKIEDWDATVEEALKMGLQEMQDDRNSLYNSYKK